MGGKGLFEEAQEHPSPGDTKAEVVRATSNLAKKSPLAQVVIHKGNGLIQKEYTYGKDPRNIPG
jgi:hypothetical protein